MASPTVSVTKKVRFSAAHFFQLPGLTPEENRARFGPNSNTNGHGHNYELLVSVVGPCDPQTGMVMNLKDLKTILEEEVITPLDFNNLNRDIDYFKDKLPTLENLSLMLWPVLSNRIRAVGLTLEKIQIHEADDMYVEYFGS